VANFGNILESIEHVQWEKTFPQKDKKAMPGATHGVLLRQLNHSLVRSGPAHQALTGSFAKCHPEFDARDGIDQRFMDILDCFNKMRLAEDEIDGFRFFDDDCFNIHGLLLKYTIQLYNENRKMPAFFKKYHI
jgi:hypothetical protein